MSDQYKKLLAELSAQHTTLAAAPLLKAMAGDGDGDEDECTQNDGEADDAFAARKAAHAKGKGKMAKAFEVTLPDGSKVQAQDGRPMLKAFAQRVDAQAVMLGQAIDLVKALAVAVEAKDSAIADLVKKVEAAEGTVKTQGESLAKAEKALEPLQKSVETIANAGRGRRSVTVQMVGQDGKRAAQEMNSREFLSKAAGLMQSGKLSTDDLVKAELAINKGAMPEARIVELVQAA